MKDIAADAGIYRSTLYRYYPNKEELAFYIVNKLLSELSESSNLMVPKDVNGFSQLCSFVDHYKDQLLAHPEYLHLFSSFDPIYAEIFPSQTVSVREYAACRLKDFQAMTAYLYLGVNDGSIKLDTDPLEFIMMLFNAMFGLAQRLLVNPESFTSERNSFCRRIVSMLVDMILISIKA